MAKCNLEERQVYWVTNRISCEIIVYASAVVQDSENFSLAHHRIKFNLSKLPSVFFVL